MKLMAEEERAPDKTRKLKAYSIIIDRSVKPNLQLGWTWSTRSNLSRKKQFKDWFGLTVCFVIIAYQIWNSAAMNRRVNSCWSAPPESATRIDVDASGDIQNHAVCASTMRGSNGNWLLGFEKSLGYVLLITEVELMAIKLGILDYIWNRLKRWTSFWRNSEHASSLVENWGIQIHHKYREALRRMDALLEMLINVQLTRAFSYIAQNIKLIALLIAYLLGE